jgi:formate hydrogenlyase transcriptional activator
MNTEFTTGAGCDEDYARFLAVASLFEGAFSIDWIQELTGRKASQVLVAAERALTEGVLISKGIGSFAFSESRARRKFLIPEDEAERCHGRIADLLIRDLPDSPGKAEIVAPHLLKIVNGMEGCRRLLDAARSYRDKFQNESALECCAKIIGDLSGRDGESADRLFCEAAIEYSKLNTAKNDVKRVLSILEEAIVRADKLKNETYLSILYMNFAKNKWLQSQYKSALKYFDDCLALARKLNDEKLQQSVDNFKTFLFYWQGLFREAVLNYEKSLADVEKIPHGRFPLLATMTVGICYGQIGQVTQGIGMIDAIRRHCLEKGDAGLAAHSGICIGAVMLDIGRLDDALLHLVPAVEEANRIRPDWTTIYGELTLAYARHLKGDSEKCLSHIRRFYRLSKQVDVSVRPWPYLMELGWAVEQGRLPPIPELSLRQEVEAMLRGENVFLKGVACRFKALIQSKEGAPRKDAVKSLERSVQLLQVSGHAVELAKSRLELARLQLMQGRQSAAAKTAGSARETLSSLNETLIPDDLKALMQDVAPRYNPAEEIPSFTRELESMGNSRDILQLIISTANRIAGAERGGIFLPAGPKEPRRLVLRASKNLTQDEADQIDFKPALKLISNVFDSGEGRVQALRLQKNLEKPGERLILSGICVPIIAKKQRLGVLYHDNRLLSNAFNESQLKVLASLASYAAVIIENERVTRENADLKGTIEKLKAHYEREAGAPPPRAEEIVGEGAEIKRVLTRIGEIAQTDTTVLILGETGVGKELVAKAILRNSQRRDKPFVTLNCSALSEELIYSELFGHERGSFTGATLRHIGRFEKAHGGTLFLDEIGDLPPDMQVRLLRVLETKEFERVGGTETIRSDFRLITATNRSLEQEIKMKTFRPDLFYRINVFPIHVPPLRERKKDIPLLVEYFLELQRQKTGRAARVISDGEMRELINYDWPGNVRELKNCIERYAVSARVKISDLLRPESQPLHFKNRPEVTLQENERRHIQWALERTNGKIHGPGGAAELLDIHPNTLAFRIKKLGIRKGGK